MKCRKHRWNLNIRTEISLNSDLFAIAALVLFFCGSAIRFILNNTVGKMGLSSLIPGIYAVLLIGFLFLSVLMNLKKTRYVLLFIGVFTAVSLYFGFTVMLHPEYMYYYCRETVGVWDELFSPVTGCIYGLLVIILCQKTECIWKGLKCCAWIDLAYYTIRVLIANKSGHWSGYDAAGNVIDTTYDLGVGYSIMFILVIFLCMYSERKRIIYLIAAGYSLVLVLNNGSRGALIGLALGISLLMICRDNTRKWGFKQKLLIVLLLIMVVVAFGFLDQIVVWIGKTLNNMGFNSRTINAMLSSTLFDDNGRNRITERALIAIEEGGVFGLGAFGDRPYIAPYYWWGYSHNIVLEIICDFGIIFGIILLGMLLKNLIHILFAPKDKESKYVFIVMLSSCGKLFVSDTIWGYPQFWALLGFMVLFAQNAETIKSDFRRLKWKICLR